MHRAVKPGPSPPLPDAILDALRYKSLRTQVTKLVALASCVWEYFVQEIDVDFPRHETGQDKLSATPAS